MGFTTGFTGGVTLTLGIAYLTVLAHQRNREHQGQILRSQAYALTSLVDPIPPPPPPTRSEVAAAARANFIDTAKDRWNAEVENAVRWVQRTDWAEVREGLEQRAAYLWTQAFGGTTEAAKDSVAQAKQEAGEKAASVSTAAKDALAQAKAKAEAAQADAKTKSSQVASALEAKVTDAKAAVQKELQKAKAAVGLTEEERTEVNADGDAMRPMSDIERALKQRYQKAAAKKTVEEALQERYTPISQRDNSKLRGL